VNSVNEEVAAVDNKVRILDEELAAMDKRREEIENEKAELEKARIAVLARTAPIRTMLPELLSRVFEYASLVSDKDGVEVPLRLVTVSHEWRKIALETPRAWGRVVIEVEDESSARPMIRRARAFLERSMATPIEIMLDILQWNRSDDRTMLLKTMLDLLVTHIGRCIRLTVRAKEEDDSPLILTTLTPHFGPTLTDFSMESRDSVRMEMPHMPYLTRLSIDDVGPRAGWSSSLVSNLKSLSLRYFKPIAFEGFITALESAKETLEELRIARCSLSFDSHAFLFHESHDKKPCFPLLRKLALVDISPGDIDVFFESIQAPALCDLFLALDSQRFRYFKFMDPNIATCLSNCPLSRLELEDACIETGSELRALLALLTTLRATLEEMVIAGGELDARFYHAMEVDPGNLPKLRSLTIRNKPEFTGRELLRIVNARQARQGISPLQVVGVDRCRSFEHDVADQLKRMGVKFEFVPY
jgi:hypothetical protein